MAYIEKEKAQVFLRTECLAKYPASFANGLLAAADQLNKLPTADVAPKSEVAREIVEEIERYLRLNEDIAIKCKRENGEKNEEYWKGKLAAFMQIRGFLKAEFKEKHTEGENGNS